MPPKTQREGGKTKSVWGERERGAILNGRREKEERGKRRDARDRDASADEKQDKKEKEKNTVGLFLFTPCLSSLF